MSAGWGVYKVIHVKPIDDIGPHEASTTCQCAPRLEEIENATLVIHNSYDGRELIEKHGIQ